jgi:protein-disulfide isomerase
LVTAVIFFAMGFLVAGLLGFNLLGKNLTADPQAIAQAVEGTFIALTPTPTMTPTTVPIQLTYSERDHLIGGPEDAKVVFVEFSDYRCPYCGEFAQTTMPRLLERYREYVKFIYRDYPIFGQESVIAAHSAHCAAQQDRFADYHFALFNAVNADPPIRMDAVTLTGLAVAGGLEEGPFEQCMADGTIAQGIMQNYLDGQALLGQTGTPTFLINGRRIVGAGSYEFFSRIINEELVKLGIEPPL